MYIAWQKFFGVSILHAGCARLVRVSEFSDKKIAVEGVPKGLCV